MVVRESPVQAGLVFSSQLDISIVSSVRETMLSVLVQSLQNTWPLLWNTWLLRFWSWLVIPPETTKRPESSHLQLTVRNNEELNKLLSGVTIAQGGILLNIQVVLLTKNLRKPRLNKLSLICYIVPKALFFIESQKFKYLIIFR